MLWWATEGLLGLSCPLSRCWTLYFQGSLWQYLGPEEEMGVEDHNTATPSIARRDPKQPWEEQKGWGSHGSTTAVALVLLTWGKSPSPTDISSSLGGSCEGRETNHSAVSQKCLCLAQHLHRSGEKKWGLCPGSSTSSAAPAHFNPPPGACTTSLSFLNEQGP